MLKSYIHNGYVQIVILLDYWVEWSRSTYGSGGHVALVGWSRGMDRVAFFVDRIVLEAIRYPVAI